LALNLGPKGIESFTTTLEQFLLYIANSLLLFSLFAMRMNKKTLQ